MAHEQGKMFINSCCILRAAIRLSMDTRTVDVTPVTPIEGPDLMVTVIVETTHPVRTTDLIKLMQMCVRYFGEQDLPTIESGTDAHTLVISRLTYVLPKPIISKRLSAYAD